MSNFAFLSMMRTVEAWSVLAATLEDPNTPSSSSSRLPSDPLVNHTWANFTHIAAIVLVACLIVVVGIVSKKIEHAIVFALIASLGLIGFFFLVGQ